MASQSAGIQQLIQAERRAADKIAEARKKKAKRLKQAKEEAQVEINAYRQQREQQFREHEAKIVGSKSDMEAQIEQERRGKIAALEQNIQQNREAAIHSLLEMVSSISPQVHQNFANV